MTVALLLSCVALLLSCVASPALVVVAPTTRGRPVLETRTYRACARR